MALAVALGLSLAYLPTAPPAPAFVGTRHAPRAAPVCVEQSTRRPPRDMRNQGAKTIVTKLSSMRTGRGGSVDMDGLGRLLRGHDIQGPMLLDVLVGLKRKDRWELCQAVALFVPWCTAHSLGGAALAWRAR